MNMFEDYDLTFLGEQVHAATDVKSGFRIGVIALTESRLVFIRKKKGREFIDREFSRDAISSSTLKKHFGSWQLSVGDNRTSSIFVGQLDELEPFVEPLRQSASANKSRRIEEQRLADSHAHPEVSDEPEPEGMYDGHDTTIIGEHLLLIAKASAGFGSGVLVLTEDRLVYVRKKKDKTFVDREFDRSAIVDVTYSKSLGSWTLGFKDGSKLLFYNQNDDDLEPFVAPLRRNAAANETRRIEEQRLANSHAHPEVSDEPGPECKYDGHDTTVTGSRALLLAKASAGFGSGVLVLTEDRLVYLRKKKGETYIDRDTDRAAISEFETKPFLNSVDLRFKDRGNLVIFTPNNDDLEPFVDPLRASADANQATVDADREARLADMICSARGRNGQVHLFEDRVLITRQGFVSAFSFGFRGDKEILIQEITSIGWKEPGFTTGYIHFGYRGGQMPVRTSVFADDSIVNNEDAVIFTEEHQPDFERLKKLLEERRAEINRPQVITAVAEGPSPMDELKKLAELKEMGIVTEDEFEQKKKQLLGL